jgi:hypothetical protein
MTMLRTLVVLGLASLLWQPDQPAPQPDAARALAAAEALWQAKKPASYQLTVQVMCFCKLAQAPPTFRVVNDVPRTTADLGESTDLYARYNSVPKLFYELRRFIEQKPVKLIVKYDPTYGFPASIDLDVRTDMADDELRVTITDFKPAGLQPRP